MTTIKLFCQGAAARVRVEGPVTAGAVGIPVELEFDSAWDGLIKTVSAMTALKKVPVIVTGSRTTVPWEVLVHGLHLYLGVEGRDAAGNTVIPTTWADCGRILPAADGAHSYKPTPNEIEQLLFLLGDYLTVEETETELPTMADYRAVEASLGSLADLKTADKSSLVAAINELWQRQNGGGQ